MHFSRPATFISTALLSALLLAACGSGGMHGGAFAPESEPLIQGKILTNDGAGRGTPPAGTAHITLDEGWTRYQLDADGRFACDVVSDGDHSLHLHRASQPDVEIPCRIFDQRPIDLGEVDVGDGQMWGHSGFDGYLCGWVDEDLDGINDQLADADGDGICDSGRLYAGHPYMMNHGHADLDRDGINDRYRDADGDHRDDDDGRPCAPGFGWVDEDHDGLHDGFRDEDGNGICDLSGMPFRHRFGHADADKDGQNDRFHDEDGDCINDRDGQAYRCGPGWIDEDGDGLNDCFRDANGDGLNDLGSSPLPYALGCGWTDANEDGVNDRYVDADGDCRNDHEAGLHAWMDFHYGQHERHVDADGDGIDDLTDEPFCMGFGWVDQDEDGINDRFMDGDGDGVNDRDGHHYDDGFMRHEEGEAGHGPGGDGGMGDGGMGGMR